MERVISAEYARAIKNKAEMIADAIKSINKAIADLSKSQRQQLDELPKYCIQVIVDKAIVNDIKFAYIDAGHWVKHTTGRFDTLFICWAEENPFLNDPEYNL